MSGGKIVDSRWLPYSLPLSRPWASAAGSLMRREGRLLRLETDDGRIGWGDCAPFPEIGIDEASAERFAWECARLDLAAQAAGVSLAQWLRKGAAPTRIAVNAVPGALAQVRDEDIASACTDGFTVLKLKVGIAEPAWEIARLYELAARLPAGVALRLDANRAWDEKTAVAFLDACTALPIESCEEPLRESDAGSLARVQGSLPFPVAVDESIHLVDEAFFADPPVRRLVLKPPRHGGLAPALGLAGRANAAGMDCVMTSSLESACGVLAAAHLAAALDNGLAHGLATAPWLDGDTGIPPMIVGGHLELPSGAGLGFVPRS